MNSIGKCQEPDMSVSILGCTTFLELEPCLEAIERLSETGAVPPPAFSPDEEGSACNNVSDLDLFDSGGNDIGVAAKQNHTSADANLPDPNEAKLQDYKISDGNDVERSEHAANITGTPVRSPAEVGDVEATPVPIEASITEEAVVTQPRLL